MYSNSHTRRHFLAQSGFGIASLALLDILQDEAKSAPIKPNLERPTFDLLPKQPHKPPQAMAMISLFMQGGPSQIDLFEPNRNSTNVTCRIFQARFNMTTPAEASAKLFASPWKFSKHGESGTELSELLPHLATVIDDICLVRSMRSGVNNHVQAIHALNNGRTVAGRPSLGSWMAYGLGTENRNLPAFVGADRSERLTGFGSRQLEQRLAASLYQGTVIRPKEPRILNLDPPARFQGAVQGNFLDYLQQINQEHFDAHPGEHDLAARISSFELAARMQTAAKEALDLTQETQKRTAIMVWTIQNVVNMANVA